MGISSSGTSGKNDEGRKEGQDKRNSKGNKREKGMDKPHQDRTGPQPDKRPWWGGKDHWASRDEAMKGVLAKEQEEYGQRRNDCWRCWRSRHRTYKCFSFSTMKGTPPPPAPWKAAAVGQREEGETEKPKKPPQPSNRRLQQWKPWKWM